MKSAALTRREKFSVALTYVVAALVVFFLVAPILVIIPLSFSQDSILAYPISAWSTRWYEALLDNPVWGTVLKNSLWIATVSTLIATVAGTLAAFGLTRPNCPFSGILRAILLLPMIVPIIITAVASYFLYSALGLVNSFTAIILAHAILGAPFVVITVSASLIQFDEAQRFAAYSLGARPVFAFRTVILPQIAPGIVSGALFAFVSSFDEVIVALFLTGSQQLTLPRQMFAGIRENIDPTISALASIMIALSLAALSLAHVVISASRKAGKTHA